MYTIFKRKRGLQTKEDNTHPLCETETGVFYRIVKIPYTKKIKPFTPDTEVYTIPTILEKKVSSAHYKVADYKTRSVPVIPVMIKSY